MGERDDSLLLRLEKAQQPASFHFSGQGGTVSSTQSLLEVEDIEFLLPVINHARMAGRANVLVESLSVDVPVIAQEEKMAADQLALLERVFQNFVDLLLMPGEVIKCVAKRLMPRGSRPSIYLVTLCSSEAANGLGNLAFLDDPSLPLDTRKALAQNEIIRLTLQRHSGDKMNAAQELGVDPRTVQRYIDEVEQKKK